jgi:hypothetical protein
MRTRNARQAHGLVLALLGSFAAIIFVAPTLAEDPPSPPPAKGESDVGEHLIKKAIKGSDDDLMTKITHLMQGAAERLEVELDAGEEAQAMQRRALEHLDQAIKIAAAQRRPRSSPSSSGESEKRESSPRAKATSRPARRSDAEAGAAASAASTTGAAPDRKEESSAVKALRDMRRGWGHLPARDREEVLQGIDEAFLDRYRAWIERYYRALQESEP